MIPYSGDHRLIECDFTSGDAPGELSGVKCREGGIALGRQGVAFVERGVYRSAAVSLDAPANEMVLSWNGISPVSTLMSVDFRVRGEGAEWSCWYELGDWKSEVAKKPRASDFVYGDLKVEHLKAARNFDTVQYKVTFSTADPSQSPLLRRVTLCVSDTRGEGGAEPEKFSGKASDLQVPWLSQRDIETVKDKVMLEAGVCAATSVTMVLKYYGIPANVRDVGRRAYDPSARIYGNWSFLAAAASEFGPDAWVERFSNWQPIEEFIASGTPAVISIAYPKGTFGAEPERETQGHLVVVRGFTESGDVIVNDPDTLDEKRGCGYVYPREELAQAFFGHGGVAIIIKK